MCLSRYLGLQLSDHQWPRGRGRLRLNQFSQRVGSGRLANRAPGSKQGSWRDSGQLQVELQEELFLEPNAATDGKAMLPAPVCQAFFFFFFFKEVKQASRLRSSQRGEGSGTRAEEAWSPGGAPSRRAPAAQAGLRSGLTPRARAAGGAAAAGGTHRCRAPLSERRAAQSSRPQEAQPALPRDPSAPGAARFPEALSFGVPAAGRTIYVLGSGFGFPTSRTTGATRDPA